MPIKTPREQFQESIYFAIVELGWTEEQFLRLTPQQWEGILDAWVLRERRTDRRFARVCAVMAQAFGGSDATEDDFMPKTAQEAQDEQDFDEMWAVMETLGPKQK